jgi:uncharacterized OB-fold protein
MSSDARRKDMDGIAEGLVSMTDQGPRLIASRCPACGALSFPYQRSCPRCSTEGTEEELLAAEGTLWTWTVQSFRPKPPFPADGEFAPYGVGYVELEGQLRIETLLTEADPHRLRIGMPMELQLVPAPGPVGEGVMFAFGLMA